MAAYVKFWGTRGSIPTPASWTRVYGGNTACIEVRFDDTVFICDAGSGIRELGKDILNRDPRPTELHLLITHAHWDHIQGFPFFAPAHLKEMRIHLYGRDKSDRSPYDLLSGQMASQYFPISFRELAAQIICDHLNDGQRIINGVRVTSFPLNHPGGCTGYSFEKDGVKIVYASDNELEINPGETCPDLKLESPLRQPPAHLLEAIEGADLLIADAQYDEKEYSSKRGWGHSSCITVTDMAIRGKVKNLALFHHDPESTDQNVDTKSALCCYRAAKHRTNLVIFPAREGVELKFSTGAQK